MRGRARVGIVLGVIVASVIGWSTPPAGAARVVGRGQVRCEGVVKFGAVQSGAVILPDFSTVATTAVTVKGSLDCVGTTGDARSTVRTVRIKSAMGRYWHCGAWDGAFTGVKQHPWTFELKWQADGRNLAPTRVIFPSWLGTQRWPAQGSENSSFTLPASPAERPYVGGSYAGNKSAISLVFDPTENFSYAYYDKRCHSTSFGYGAKNKVNVVLTLTL